MVFHPVCILRRAKRLGSNISCSLLMAAASNWHDACNRRALTTKGGLKGHMAGFVLSNTTEDDRRGEDIRHRDPVNTARKERLDQVVEGQVIPRLMVAHSLNFDALPNAVNIPEPPQEDAALIEDLTATLLKADTRAIAAKLEELRISGMTTEAILLSVMAPAARRLGIYWEEDRVTFADVTVSLSRLQQALRLFAPTGPGQQDALPNGHRILLASVPGDQHTFGVFMVEEFFRRAGWDVVTCVLETSEELLSLAAFERFSIVGFSLSRDDLFNEMVSNIRKIYKVAKNRNVRVLVGGRYFIDAPHRFKETGADGMARDGQEAVALANSFIGLAAPR